jgi:hypothetical protein
LRRGGGAKSLAKGALPFEVCQIAFGGTEGTGGVGVEEREGARGKGQGWMQDQEVRMWKKKLPPHACAASSFLALS